MIYELDLQVEQEGDHIDNLILGCTIRVLPGSAMRALSTFSPHLCPRVPTPLFHQYA